MRCNVLLMRYSGILEKTGTDTRARTDGHGQTDTDGILEKTGTDTRARTDGHGQTDTKDGQLWKRRALMEKTDTYGKDGHFWKRSVFSISARLFHNCPSFVSACPCPSVRVRLSVPACPCPSFPIYRIAATIVKSKFANSHENIWVDRSKLYMFAELVHIYCYCSISSASILRLAKCEASCEMRSHAN